MYHDTLGLWFKDFVCVLFSSFNKFLCSLKMNFANSARKRKGNETLKSTGTKRILENYWSLKSVDTILSWTTHSPLIQTLLWLQSQQLLFNSQLPSLGYHFTFWACSTCWNVHIHQYSEPALLQILFQLPDKSINVRLIRIAQKELFPISTCKEMFNKQNHNVSSCWWMLKINY